MAIPRVERGRLVTASEQNVLIDQVNQNASDIEVIKASPGGGGGDVNDAIEAHVIDPTPHPIYDDIPSLIVLFENGLV